MAPNEWSVMLHDAATTHKGKKEPKRQAGQAAQPTVHYHFDSSGQPQALKAWLADRRVVEGDVPPGLTSFRPNNQRMFNFLFRWKYDQTLAQLNGTTDFRAPHVDTDVRIVLTAVAITTKWLNEHPECGAAAWIMSTVTEEADYRAQGKGKLFEKALQAMRDPAYKEITAEYKKNGGLWKTESVVMVSQILDTLDDAADTQNKKAIAEATGSMSWLTGAATQARRSYAQTFGHAAAQQKKKVPAAVVEAEEGRAKIQKIAEYAAQQFKDELAEKKAKAEAKHLELVKQATVALEARVRRSLRKHAAAA